MIMKNLFSVVLACLFLTVGMAQNKVINDQNAQVRNVKGFHGIRIANGIHLYLNQGNEEAVAVSASDPTYRDYIVTEVHNGILEIYLNKEHWNWWHDIDRKKLRAYVSCKVLDELKAASGARVEVDGSIKSDELKLDFSSGANFIGTVQVSKLKAGANSGAEAEISGSATNCTVEAGSGGSLKAYDLVTDICDASTSSGASLSITVNKELSASASSGGEIHYKGTGVIREISTGSGGEVSKR
jgi:Putative auto-transporter adhesin, head GIN domain